MNLLKSCIGSHCRRYRSTVDYIFLPNCRLDNILMVKTFDLDIGNTSDHVPIQLNISCSSRLLKEQDKQSIDSHGFKQKVDWSRFSQKEINEKFVAPLLTSLASFDHYDLNDVSKSTDKITKQTVDCSFPLVTPKSGVVTFGETEPIHCKSMKEREWALGDDMVEELYKYQNLGVLKNYCGSFASNISDNIDKTRKKAGVIFSSNADRRKTNPLIYV